MRFTLYEGPSALDGAPIVALATFSKSNRKTGHMIQVSIMRSDVAPGSALKSGDDASVCGQCKFRPFIARALAKAQKESGGPKDGDRQLTNCYVRITGQNSAWRAWKAKGAPAISVATLAKLGPIRLGSYGDPAAVPFSVWAPLLKTPGASWTGYTHQWRTADPRFASLLMASADTPEEQAEALARGWRTYRVRRWLSDTPEPLFAGEISCPASPEAGKKTNCAFCGLCNGKGGDRDKRRAIAAIDHGPRANARAKLAAWVARP